MTKILFLMTLLLTAVGVGAQTPVLELTSDKIGTSYPYELSETDAAKVYALSDLTIAVRINTDTQSGRKALFATSDPTLATNTSAEGKNSRYVAYGMNESDGGYLASWRSGDRFTGGGGITANTQDMILVYVVSPTANTFKVYLNGTEKLSKVNAHTDGFMTGYEIATPAMVKADHPNAKIYIGGGKHSGGSGEVFNGTITGVKVYSGALSASEIAAINFQSSNTDEEVYIEDPSEFKNGEVYTFVTSRGWMGAKDSNDKVISTAYTANGVTGSKEDPYFQWTVYQSSRGNYYLYNLGKGMFMGKESSNNTAVPFVQIPISQDLTFKKSSNATYPIMFSTDGAAVVNHSANHASGLISWTGGWNTLDDDGSNHQVTLVKTLTDTELKVVADRVAEYEKYLYVKVEVEDWDEQNPNTHFGCVTATLNSNALSTKLTTANMTVSEMSYNGVGDVISFTRPYRGFTFQGFYLGEQSLGESFTLTEDQKTAITEDNPLIAKFTTTDDVTLFYDDDEYSYRIPAIATTSTGRIIAVSDYRHNLDDIGRDVHGTGKLRIDLVMRYSDDNGKTWSAKQTIAEGSGNKNADGYDCAYGDAAIATVGKNVLVMAAAGNVCYPNGSATKHNRTVRLFSADNGVTWSKEDISEKMFISSTATIPNGHTAFFGSGKLAVDSNFNGTGNARIYGGMLVKDASTTTNVYVVYTDDFGENWKVLGGVKAANADEPKVEILPNGQILLSARRQGGRLFNVFTYGTGADDKANGAGTWNGTANGCNNGGSNGTNGEIFLVDAKKSDGTAVKLLMQSQPKGGSGHYDRKDVTIWYKEVDANTTYTTATIKDNWTEGMQVSYQQSSYSVATLQTDGRIGFFFEEAPCYGDDYTKGYCMVYTPLTIESITKANYFSPNADLDVVKTINVVLTDALGNTYRDQVECLIDEITTTLTQKYPFITLGDNASYDEQGETCTYTNTVELPFKVSNGTTTIWHNIYFPINTNEYNYPAYMSGQGSSDVVKICTESAVYGNSTFNTLEKADYISWAIYQSGEGFSFILKNKLTNKYLKTTSEAGTGTGGENVKYTDNIEEATPFILSKEGHSNNYLGEYNLKIDNGCICVWSVSNGYATYSQNKNHKGAWVKFAEAPDFEALIAGINESLNLVGTGLGQYDVDGADAIKAAMENSNTVKQNALNSYKTTLDGATLNTPVDGQFFRIAYDNSTEKLYLQSLASSIKGVQFTAETDNTSIWLYHDGALYSYKAGQCLREVGDDRGLQAIGGKTEVTFTASPRTKGKYNIACTSYIHANSSNGKYFTDHCSGDGGHEAHDLILEEVTSLPITISAAKYATFYAPVAVAVPDGVTAYTVTVNGEWTTLHEIESGVIPANTGVILGGEAAAYDLDITATETTITDNDLLGTVAAQYVKDYAYVLGIKNGNLGLHKVVLNKTDSGAEGTTHFLNNAFKSYLPASAVPSAVKSLLFTFGETTNIEESVINTPLGENAPIYDLSGRRVLSTMKGGIYIQNGKKFIVK